MSSARISLLALVGGLFFGDQPFDGGQRVGVQAGRHQPGVQGIGPGGPAVVGAFGLVEGGVGAQRVEFVPGQVVAGSQAQRGVGGVAALEQQARAGGGGLGGVDAGAGGQGGGTGRASGRGGRRW